VLYSKVCSSDSAAQPFDFARVSGDGLINGLLAEAGSIFSSSSVISDSTGTYCTKDTSLA
jgi:hypothetical protein